MAAPKKQKPKTKEPSEGEGLGDLLGLTGLDSLVKAKVEEIENSLAVKLDGAVAGIYTKITEDIGAVKQTIADQVKSELRPGIEAIPTLIEGQVKQIQNDLHVDLKNIIDQLPDQLIERAKAERGNSGAAGIGSLLERITPADIISIVNAFKAPGSDQQLAGIFGTFLKGMTFGQKLKSGQITPDDMEDALGLTIQKPK